MMKEHKNLNNHEKFKELGALANSGTLTGSEQAELKGHLEVCEECRQIYDQYATLASEGIPLLAARYGDEEAPGRWQDMPTRMKLFARVQAAQQQAASEQASQMPLGTPPNLLRRILVSPMASVGLAACFVVAIGLVAYHISGRAQSPLKRVPASAEYRPQNLQAETGKLRDELLDAYKRKLLLLQDVGSQMDQEIVSLRSSLRTTEDHANKLAAANSAADEELRQVSRQRDALTAQLRDTQQAYESVQAELISLRAERDKDVLRTASFETRIEELSAVNRDVQRRLRDDEQYLASDRDIRELMGARKLYIADVFDVDSNSRTRKPFGRVFYTQGKSLIFYAFDLDDQPSPKNTSTFQAWGRSDTGEGKALNLGFLYLDNESNRRWVLRCDNPKQLEGIDSVFVTVEPQGGSLRPTGKPYLYAMLRKEPNHP